MVAGLKPYDHVIRGRTDGSRLTELGLPTPNLFCGGHNAHGPLEWVAVQDMESAVTACVHLAELWGRKGRVEFSPRARGGLGADDRALVYSSHSNGRG